jgi:hypothetical protein
MKVAGRVIGKPHGGIERCVEQNRIDRRIRCKITCGLEIGGHRHLASVVGWASRSRDHAILCGAAEYAGRGRKLNEPGTKMKKSYDAPTTLLLIPSFNGKP